MYNHVHTGSKDSWDLYSALVRVFVDDIAVHIGIEVMCPLAKDTEGSIVSNSLS